MSCSIEELKEALAAYAHSAWAGWMRYILSRSILNPDDSYTVPRALVDRWLRQMSCPYEILQEPEKDSDRAEAMKMIEIFNGWTEGCSDDDRGDWLLLANLFDRVDYVSGKCSPIDLIRDIVPADTILTVRVVLAQRLLRKGLPPSSIERPLFCTDAHLEYLDRATGRGVTNMWDVIPLLEDVFETSRARTEAIVRYWTEVRK